MSQSQIQFIQHEMAVWGADYIDDLLDRGFEPTLVVNARGGEGKWTWLIPPHPVQPLVTEGRVVEHASY
jgi:hypothetical protein